MTEILTQDEIDSLLNAVSTGALPRASEPVPRARRPQSVVAYDFRRPNRISKEQVRTLQMLHDSFARSLSSTLSAYLRSTVEVQLMSVEQVTYGEFMLSVVRPSTLGVFEMLPLKGGAILDVSPHLVFPIIDRILGGPGRAAIRIRELTEIERSLVDRIFRRLLVDLQQAWLQVKRLDLRLLNIETNPQFVQLTSPNDTAILIDFDLRVGETQGGMSLCLPFAMLEPILPKLVTQRWFGPPALGESDGLTSAIAGALQTTRLNVRAVLAPIRLPIDRLTRLVPGEILPLSAGPELPVTVEVEGQPRFAGRVGQRQRRRAVEITALLNPGGEPHA